MLQQHINLAVWLRDLGLERYTQAFQEAEVTPEVLPEVTDADLRELGLPLGPRRAVLKAIRSMAGPSVKTPGVAEAARLEARPDATPAPSEAERRQLTVMFVDLVGSTALSTRLDPEEMREVLKTYQNAVAGEVSRFEGFVAKLMGDGVLAYFGWPKAHEDEAERAVQAGLAVARAVAALEASDGSRLQARVGIATGTVVVGELIGEGEAQERAVVGETPNLAARLQAAAEPGQVVVTDATRRLLGGMFECTDAGAVEAKGVPRPVRAWIVERERAAESRFEALHGSRLIPLIGRAHELGLLLDRWTRAKEGEGQVVSLVGEPGIGKSRLVQALRERLSEEPHTCLRYQCSPQYTSSALRPVIDQLERAADLTRDDPPATKLNKLKALLGGSVVPFLAELLAIPVDGLQCSPELTPQQKKAQLFQALLAQLETLAAERPMLMVLEDVHWLDPTTRELFDLVVARLQRLPVLLVGTFRPELTPPWTGYTHVTLLTLNRLGRGQAQAIMAELTGGRSLPAEIVAQIVDKTDGVPLFIEELTKTVLEAGLLRETGGKLELTGPLPPLAIPSTLQDSLMARLDRLASVKEVAQVGAVIGREFTYELLVAVAPLGTDELQDALQQLVAAELVFQRGTPPETSYVFKHALVRDAAYESLLKSKRQQLHSKIASVLEERFPEMAETGPEVLAMHLTEAGLAEQAVGWWLKAGKRALARSAMSEAVTQLTRGLDLLKALPSGQERQIQELDLQVVLGNALIAVKGFAAPETGRAYARAYELCRELGDTPTIFPALFGQVMISHLRAEHETALEISREMLRLAERQGDLAGLVSAHRCLGASLHHLGRPEPARTHLERTLALYDPATHPALAFTYAWDPRMAALAWLCWNLLVLGYPDQARTCGQQALAEARALAHLNTLATALVYAAIGSQLRRDYGDAARYAEEVIELADKHGFPLWRAGAAMVHGCTVAICMDPQRGATEVEEGLGAWRGTGAEGWVPCYLALAAEAYIRAGRIDAALAATNDGLARVNRTEARWSEAELHRLQGELRLTLPKPDRSEAEGCFHKAITVARAQSAKWWELRAAISLARLWADQGERQKACDLLAPIYGWFTEGFATLDLVEANQLLESLR